VDHRHLEHNDLTLTAIDDIIERGTRSAWAELGRAVQNDPVVRAKTRRITDNRTTADPLNQRFAFWGYYVDHIQ
jgi:hypothetical protein